jgi:hypothetical protein
MTAWDEIAKAKIMKMLNAGDRKSRNTSGETAVQSCEPLLRETDWTGGAGNPNMVPRVADYGGKNSPVQENSLSPFHMADWRRKTVTLVKEIGRVRIFSEARHPCWISPA